MTTKIGRIRNLAAVALVLVGCGILSDIQGAASCNECYGFSPGLLIAPVFAIIGVVVGLVALIGAARDALYRRARASGMLLMLCVILGLGALVYLYAVSIADITRVEQHMGESLSANGYLLQLYFYSSPIGWNCAVFAAPAAAALVYLLLRGKTRVLYGAVDGLAAVAVLAVALLVADVGGPALSAYITSKTPVLSAYSQDNVEQVDCTQATFPPFLVRNVGGGTLNWTATVIPMSVKMQPSSGSIGGGGSQTVTLTGVPSASPNWYSGAGIQMTFNSNGGREYQSYGCLAPVTPPAALTVKTSSITGNCQQGEYPGLIIADISQDYVAWTAFTTEPGITIVASSNMLSAGEEEIVFINGTTSSRSFTIVFNYDSPTTSQPVNVTITVTCG